MKISYRVRGVLLLLGAAMVATISTRAIFLLYERADESRRVPIVLVQIEEQAVHLSAIQWQAIGSHKVDVNLRAQLAARREKIAALLEKLAALDPSGKMSPQIGSLYLTYSHAIDEELRLVEAGRIDDAERLVRQKGDPGYESLEEAIEELDRELNATAESDRASASAGSSAIALLSVLAIGILLWRFDRVRQRERAVAVEKNVLERSEEHFRKLVQFSSDVTMVLKSDGTIGYVSVSVDRMLGYKAEWLIGTPLSNLVHEDEGGLLEFFIDRCLSGEEVAVVGEFHVRHGDGSWRYLGAVGDNWVDDPTVDGIVVNMRDITERKRMEEELSVKNRELEMRNSELSTLYGVAEAIGGATDTSEVLARALDAIMEIGPFGFLPQGGAFVLDGDKLRLAYYRGDGHTQEFLKLHEDLKLGECLCGLAARTGELVVSRNSAEDERHTIRCPEAPDHGHVIVPLKSMGKVVGVMYLYQPARAEVDDRAMMLLHAIGDRVGTALENVMLYEKMRELSLRDPLTGLANRRMMRVELEKSFARARRLGRPFSLVMLDLDHFKQYNDTHGHAVGDKLLADVGTLILREIREVDLAVRYGGEEFLLILPDTSAEDAANVAERLRKRVMETDFHFSDLAPPGHVTISPGVASYEDRVASESQLVEMADKAMYEAKKKGRNRVEVWAA